MENASSEEGYAFITLSVFAVLVAMCFNCMFIYCSMIDTKLHCILNSILSNQSGADMLISLALVLYNVLRVLPGQDDFVNVCYAYVALTFASHVQTLFLLMIITYDRVQLIKGVLQYRHFMTSKIANRMIALAWVLTIPLTVLCFWLMKCPEMPHCSHLAWNNRTVYECSKGFLTYDLGSYIELLLLLVVVVLYGYVLYMFKRSQDVLSSIQMFEQRKSTNEGPDSLYPLPRLSARDSTAIAFPIMEKPLLQIQAKIMEEDLDIRSDVTLDDDQPPDDVPEQKDTKRISDTFTTGTTGSDFPAYDFNKVRRSVAFESHTDLLKTNALTVANAGGVQATMTGSKTSYCSVKSTSTATKSVPFEGSASNYNWVSTNPWGLAACFPRLGKRHSSTSWRSDTKAAQQLGVLLLMTLLCTSPQLLFRAIVAAEGWETMNTEVAFRWLLLLAHMRALSFPIIYCVYSPRLRGHFLRHLLLCQGHSFRIVPKNNIIRTDSRTDPVEPEVHT